MNFQGKILESWFLDESKGKQAQFPHGEDYGYKYCVMSDALHTWVHPEVEKGAMIKDGGLLTGHASHHVRTLQQRCGELLEGSSVNLSLLEIYILLVAAHIHDVGNVLGRKGHEVSAQKILELIGNGIVGQDKLVNQCAFQIAQAHKGNVLHILPSEDHVLGHPVKVLFLAALLKFADELAENYQRANNLMAALGELPPESELYHQYAQAVNTIKARPQSRDIIMMYNVDRLLMCKKFQKKDETITLLDEIHLRVLKTYAERVYCMKYLRPYINIDTIKVTIRIEENKQVVEEKGYELEESSIVQNESLTTMTLLWPDVALLTSELICPTP
ncbi:MAG: hypothetical protein K8H89_11305 [Flavobacteriales bacterium]|nr:hypothetical protein [Flavobacteriales bacterium]